MPDPTPMEQDHEKSQPRQSTRERIPRRRFEIKGEAFMIAPHDDENPKNVKEALSGPKAKEWIKAMENEIESMNANESGTWLICYQDKDPLEVNGFLKSSVRWMGQ